MLNMVFGVIQNVEYKILGALGLHILICFRCFRLEMGMRRLAKAAEPFTATS